MGVQCYAISLRKAMCRPVKTDGGISEHVAVVGEIASGKFSDNQSVVWYMAELITTRDDGTAPARSELFVFGVQYYCR
jgi:hypothetical protein